MDNLTVAQVAAKLNISGTRVRVLCQSGQLPAVKFGKAWMITQADLDAYEPRPAGRPKSHDPIAPETAER